MHSDIEHYAAIRLARHSHYEMSAVKNGLIEGSKFFSTLNTASAINDLDAADNKLVIEGVLNYGAAIEAFNYFEKMPLLLTNTHSRALEDAMLKEAERRIESLDSIILSGSRALTLGENRGLLLKEPINQLQLLRTPYEENALTGKFDGKAPLQIATAFISDVLPLIYQYQFISPK